MLLTFIKINLLRLARDWSYLTFALGLPVFMYLIFGSTYGDQSAGDANISFYVMASMAVYGGVVATTGVASGAATEYMQGWGRQLALTPLKPLGYVLTKVACAMVLSAAAVALLFVVGSVTGSQAANAGIWVATFAITWLLSSVFALYGLAVAQTLKGESAPAVASSSLVVLAFFGNLFVPLSGLMLQIARFTPLYGYMVLVRWPFMQGHTAPTYSETGVLVPGPSDPLWLAMVNVLAWTAVFGIWAAYAVRKGRRRAA